MKAVNLVPVDQRTGRAAGRSGVAVYGLLGALGVAVLLVCVIAVLGKHVHNREAEVTALETQAGQAETRAAEFARYKQLAKDTGGRVQRVRALAAGRVDWATALGEVARFLGNEVRFDSVRATSSPKATVSGTVNPLRAALATPALEIAGCARDHAAVARLMARFRAMNGVDRVSLSSSDEGKDGATAGGSSSGGSSGSSHADCSGFAHKPATFNVVVFLAPPAAAAPAVTTGTPTAASTATPRTGASR